MKQIIFINTSVQLERFCFVYFISTEQQNWLHGWALRDLHMHPAYLASAARFKLLMLFILQSGIRKARLLLARVISHAYSFTAWLVLAVATLWTQGNPQTCALIAIHKPPHLQGLTESSQKRGTGLWKTYSHWEVEISGGLISPPSRHLCPQLCGSLNSTFLPRSYKKMETDTKPQGTASTDQLDCGARKPIVQD